MARKIKLRSTEICVVKGAKPIPFVYSDIIQTVLKQSPPGGFGFEDMAKSLKITDKVEALKEGVDQYLTLEDADWTYLRDRVVAFRWGYAHHELLAFRDAVVDAENFEIAQPAES